MSWETIGFFDDEAGAQIGRTSLIDCGLSANIIHSIIFHEAWSADARNNSVYVQELTEGQTLISVFSSDDQTADRARALLIAAGASMMGRRRQQNNGAVDKPAGRSVVNIPERKRMLSELSMAHSQSG